MISRISVQRRIIQVPFVTQNERAVLCLRPDVSVHATGNDSLLRESMAGLIIALRLSRMIAGLSFVRTPLRVPMTSMLQQRKKFNQQEFNSTAMANS